MITVYNMLKHSITVSADGMQHDLTLVRTCLNGENNMEHQWKSGNPVIEREGRDILESERFKRSWNTGHHMMTNIACHSLAVAEYALHLYEKEQYPDTEVRDVVRACLLHDIGMTDEGIHERVSFLKAYLHPRRSAEIAEKEFGANRIQIDAILHHMWPICVVPPHTPVGWLLLRADKYCSRKDVVKYFRKR